MKKMLAMILSVLIVMAAVPSIADIPDISGLTYDELVQLKDQINLMMWNSQEWQEVTVPQGTWKVGVDIPAGHWTIKACPGAIVSLTFGTALSDNGKTISYSSSRLYVASVVSESYIAFDPNQHISEIDYELIDGDYIEISLGSVIFTPYSGKPGFGFK